MNFDNTENAVLRYIKWDEDYLSIRFSDGVLFKWKIPINKNLKPSELVRFLDTLSEEIDEKYKEKS